MEFNMDKYYLYKEYYNYRINKIERINNKTVRMDYNTLIKKEDFEKEVVELTEKEVDDYKNLLTKLALKSPKTERKISDFRYEIGRLENSIQGLSEFVSVDIKTDELQETINNLKMELDNILHPIIEINNTRFKFKWVNDFEKVEG